MTAACGTVEDPPGQSQKAEVIRRTDDLMRRQDVFLQRARDVLMEIEALRTEAGWPQVRTMLRLSRSSNANSSALLTRQWDLSGEEAYLRARRLLEQSAALERERLSLVHAWELAMGEARTAVSAAQYSPRQREATVANTELFYEMNKTALSRFALDDAGFLTLIGPVPIRR
jgi:hypothetical protein